MLPKELLVYFEEGLVLAARLTQSLDKLLIFNIRPTFENMQQEHHSLIDKILFH